MSEHPPALLGALVLVLSTGCTVVHEDTGSTITTTTGSETSRAEPASGDPSSASTSTSAGGSTADSSQTAAQGPGGGPPAQTPSGTHPAEPATPGDPGRPAQPAQAAQPGQAGNAQGTAPGAQPTPSGPPRELEPSVIAGVVHAEDAGIRRCYDRNNRRRGRERYGRLEVAFEIQLDGSVSNARLAENTLNQRRTEQCILRIIGGLTFPEHSGLPIDVQVPFDFASSHTSFVDEQ